MLKRYLIAVAAVLMLGALSVMSRDVVQAEVLLQDVERLDGKNIYFTEAAGEASRFDRSDVGLSRFAGLLTQLGASLFTLEWRTGFPTDADLIVIAGPTSDLAADQVARLWSYINNGGNLLLLANSTAETRRALPQNTGLFSLMYADMGIRGLEDVVVDSALLEIEPEAEATDEATGEPLEATQEEILARLNNANFSTGQMDASHPITAGLEGELQFFIARSLEADSAIQGFTVTPLVTSADTFYGETDYLDYLAEGVLEFNIDADRTQGALPLAAAYDNPRTGSRIVIVGDREFATNGRGLYTSPRNSPGFLYPNNARFLINAALWLLEAETVELEFPTPGPTPTVTITPTPAPPTATPTPRS